MTHTTPKDKLPPSIIETERLIIRTPRIEDAFALHELAAADPSFANATVGQASSTLENTCTAIARMLEDRRAGIGSWWVVTHKDSGRTIGVTGFSDRHHGHGPLTALASDALGRGYAQEVIEALILCSSPRPSRHDSFENKSREQDDHRDPAPPTRWYWHAKSARSHQTGKLRCA